MKTTLHFLIFTLFTSLGFSQSMLTGRVLDENNDPVFFATVALYNAQDSSLVAAESTDDNGIFNISKIKDGNYYAVASMLSYGDVTVGDINFPAMKGQEVVFNLLPDANLLTTIEIKDKAPLLEQRADKLIVNVEGNITNTSGNLLDVMKKVPGMLVVRDRLSLAGSESSTSQVPSMKQQVVAQLSISS